MVPAGRQDTREEGTIEGMNASGATFSGERPLVRWCVFRDSGRLGLAPMAHDLLFTDALVVKYDDFQTQFKERDIRPISRLWQPPLTF